MPAKKTSTAIKKTGAKTLRTKARPVAKPARKSPSAKPKAAAQAKHKSSPPKNLLQAGLSALSLPRAESAMADGLSKMADSFGFKKLEDVFDQRVASALERIGSPSAAEFSRLVAKVEALTALVESLSTKSRK